MNAYELADELQDVERIDPNGFIKDAINMLRQQAQAIATLSDRIAELEKSAEPVAWIKKDTLIFLGNYEFGSITIQVQKQKDDEFDIPLYTTPQIKKLSDEEIKPLLDRIQNYLECGGFFNPECMEHDKVRDLIMDCKTILKKSE
ncbi:MAG: hypothetical protein LLF94_04995 [Chlamydiales bacterium]|nr:hypothetical protein [Chlamydiales bacterium]